MRRPNGWVRYPRWAFSGLITIIGGIRRIVSQRAKLALPLMIAVWALLLINCGCREIWTRFFSSLAFQHCLHPASRNPSHISRWHHLTLISDKYPSQLSIKCFSCFMTPENKTTEIFVAWMHLFRQLCVGRVQATCQPGLTGGRNVYSCKCGNYLIAYWSNFT